MLYPCEPGAHGPLRATTGLAAAVPEEELPVQVGEVDGVHINDVNVAEAREGDVLEQLAAQAARADNEDAGLLLQKLAYLEAECRPQRTASAGSAAALARVSGR